MISVLYVDDDPGLLEIGKIFLEQRGQFSVDIITSAPAALTLLNSKNYDAIISDYQMPGMDGIEFLKKVRISGNTIPFVLFTGRGREEVVIQALNEGADFYLQKGGEPVSQFTELSHKIRQAVQQRKAEASIRDHERRESDILNFLPDATFAIDTNGVVIAWNRAMEMMSGVRASEILGKGDYEYALPFYPERRPILIDLVLHEDPTIETKYPLMRRDGRTLIAETTSPVLYNGRGGSIWITATPLNNTHGTITGAIESVRDITDRIQADEELQAAYGQIAASEEKFRDIVETSPDMIWETDTKGVFTYMSPQCARMTGYSPEEIIGRPIFEFVPEAALPPFRKIFSETVLTKKTHLGPDKGFDLPIHCKDGHVIIVDVHAIIRNDNDGCFLGFRGISSNVTETRKAEEALRESEEKYRRIVETANEGILVLDTVYTMAHVNRKMTDILGYSPEELIGRNITMIIFPEDILDHDIQMLQRKEGLRETYEHRYRCKDGSECWVMVSASPILGEDGTFQGSIAMFTDITERRRTEEALRESEEKYRVLVENAGESIVVAQGDYLKFVNQRTVEISGYLRRNFSPAHSSSSSIRTIAL